MIGLINLAHIYSTFLVRALDDKAWLAPMAETECPHDIRIVATRWQIVTKRSTSDNSGCEQRIHRPIRLANCRQPLGLQQDGFGMVCATGIEPVTCTIQQFKPL